MPHSLLAGGGGRWAVLSKQGSNLFAKTVGLKLAIQDRHSGQSAKGRSGERKRPGVGNLKVVSWNMFWD
jgi:hypothetical protein